MRLVGLRPGVGAVRRRYRALDRRFSEDFAAVRLEALPGRRAVQLHALSSTLQDMADLCPSCLWQDGQEARSGRVLLFMARVLLVLSTVERSRAEEVGPEGRNREPGIEHCAAGLLDRLCVEADPWQRALLLDAAAAGVRESPVSAGELHAYVGDVEAAAVGEQVGELLEALAEGERLQLCPRPPRARDERPAPLGAARLGAGVGTSAAAAGFGLSRTGDRDGARGAGRDEDLTADRVAPAPLAGMDGVDAAPTDDR